MVYDIQMDKIYENTPYWYVTENILNNQKVLDVGCATGYLGEYLKNNFDVTIVGIDYQDYHLEKARERDVYSDLIKLDLNSFKDELNEYTSYFDRIILCDVLEHLNNPMEVLGKLSKFLKSDGKFLIDIPNIAHASIKYNLLTNNFNYTPMGLLDETHIRFFTLNSIINGLSQNKFLIDKVEYIFLGPGQGNDQYVDYGKYPKEIINYIENDVESIIYQIFIVFEKSNLDMESIVNHNLTFKELKDDLIIEKEKYCSLNNNPIKTLEETIQEKDNEISNLKENLQEKEGHIQELKTNILEKEEHIIVLSEEIKAKIVKIKSLSRIIDEMRNSRSWRITKPIRSFVNFLRNLKNRNSKALEISLKNPSKISIDEKTYDLVNTLYSNNFHSCYVDKSDRFFEREEGDPKLIAFYLPQFHTIPENDEWWGKGFTEWANVTRAVPQIKGQYQPQLPDELGFYDLSNNDIFYKQIELAKKYGIYGFCFYYYWFSGKRLLEKPIFNYLNDKNLDFPFMLCWANEPWTRAWDGSEKEVIMSQSFEEEDYLKFIEDIMPFFKDERYIKINNSPLLIIYRPQYFPKESMNAAIEVWKDYVKQNGFEDLYLINAESQDFDSDNKYDNFDASVQFFSYKMQKRWIKDENAVILNPEFTGRVYDLEAFVKGKTYLEDYDYTLYRTVMPSWDNTARTLSNAMIFNNSSPEVYKEWLKNIIEYTKKNFSKNNRYIFVNAWNEWAEGNHLEPDRKYGFAYLEATLDALTIKK